MFVKYTEKKKPLKKPKNNKNANCKCCRLGLFAPVHRGSGKRKLRFTPASTG